MSMFKRVFGTRTWLSAAVVLALVSCSKKVEGPKPTVDPPSASAAPPPVDPEIVCAAQLTTEVTVHGEHFSPIPIDIPKDVKTAIPTITLTRSHELAGAEVSEPDEVVYSGNYDADPTNALDDAGELILADGKPLLQWKSQQEMSFQVTQDLVLGPKPAKGQTDARTQGMLPVGVWDVHVENANHNGVDSLGALAVVDKPGLETPSPGIVCLEQSDQELALTGTTFLRNEAMKATLAVEGLTAPLDMTLGGCTAIAHEGLDAETCESATVTLKQGSIDVGFWALNVHNPETAACTSEDDRKLRVVPPPTIDVVEESLACVAQGDRSFTIHGKDFLLIDGEAPQITIGGKDFPLAGDMGGCMTLETQGHDVQVCDSIPITVHMGELDPDLYAVTVLNPQPGDGAGCDVVAMGALRISAPPAITEVQPALVCLDDHADSVTVLGSDFLVVDGTNPTVTVDGTVLDAADVTVPSSATCADLDTDGHTVQRCDALQLALAMGSVAAGTPEIKVENPQPAGCTDSATGLLTVAPGPTVTKAEPALLCTVDGSKAITITGTGFLTVDSALPSVMIGGNAVTSVDGAGGTCSDVTVNGLTVQSCTELTVTVAQGLLAEGVQDVTVENPAPAGCSATRTGAVAVPPALAVSMVEPINVCVGATNATLPVVFTGTGFLDVQGTLPTVIFAVGTADEATLTPTLPSASCTDLAVDGLSAGDVKTCTELDATVNLTSALTAAAGAIPVTIENTAATACDLTVATAINVVEPPTVDLTCNYTTMGGPGTGSDPCINILDVNGNAAASDTDVCSDLGFSLVITGTNFVSGMTVLLDNADDTLDTLADDVIVDSPTQITAVFSNGLPYDAANTAFNLLLSTAGNCNSVPVIGAVDVNPTPLVFFVDPPVVYNNMSTDVTVFAAGLNTTSTLDTIELIDPSSGDSDLLTVVANPKPTRIVATIPNQDPDTSNPYLAGSYDVKVTSVLGCSGVLPGGVKITDTLNAGLVTSIAPKYVSSTTTTAVTIAGSGFTAVPRVYISSGPGTSATPLEAVEVRSGTELSAIVPAGVQAGTYDLIVVNPNGDVDVLAGAVVVMSVEPPVIEATVPASVQANQTRTISLVGSGFDVATSGSVVLLCDDAGTNKTVTGTVTSATATSADVQFNMGAGTPSAPAAGSVCVVRLTNADGSSFDYSAVSVTNSSLNIAVWSGFAPNPNLMTGRRGLIAAAGRPTNTTRYLYAVGGDAGGGGDPFARGSMVTSVESARVGLYGDVDPFSYQRNDLSNAMVGGTVTAAPRTQGGGARIGKFIYLVGGHDGSSATNTLLRAQILDPLATPSIEELDAQLGDPDLGTGLGGGLYYYRIAAIFPGNDASNPGGESLAGELLPVQLPSVADGIVLTLQWAPVPGAHGYRIYRTKMAGNTADQLELLFEKTCGAGPNDLCDCVATSAECLYTDDGTRATDSTKTPMPAGSTGVWHDVAGSNLNSAREALVSTAVYDAAASTATSDVYYLYAIGGRDGGGAYLNTFEVATVTVTLSDGSQSVSTWRNGTDTLRSVRAELGAWLLNGDNSPIIRGSANPNDQWLFYGGGRTTGGAYDHSIEAGKVGTDGDITLWVAQTPNPDAVQNDYTGFACAAANDQVYTFGGNTNSVGSSAALCGATASGGCNGIPDLTNPNQSPGIQRMFMGYTQESAFLFVLGGHDGTSALSSMERTVQ